MNQSVAIVGIACRYPDAESPHELWQNVLSERRAFRRMPSERLNLDDYYSPDKNAPDRIYQSDAALIEGYEFDRVRFRVAGRTFRATDLTHWLALDIASQALADAGFAHGEAIPHENTGVIIGNTLTGEFSRASVMRLRWPYVRRMVESTLLDNGWDQAQRASFLSQLEVEYKSPFEPIGEESLAGGLANTIAGRICNYFDLKGGGYTVDGACSSSLLAVKTACAALINEDMDVAIAGGVDLSLDPFELVGFAKTGALTAGDMRIYDQRSGGFLPGEGCGMVVLMRYEDAVVQERDIYAVIRGWGISSDGSGGITRPEVDGQSLALKRAYRRSGFALDTVTYIEGHGTGTAVGDAVELRTLSRVRQAAAAESKSDSNVPPAVIGSIKGNIGHTKAAAGIAGLIKATMAIHQQILPPATGTIDVHNELKGDMPALRVLSKGEIWPAELPLRAGVNAMGFGGINSHIVLEGVSSFRRHSLTSEEAALLSSAQDSELLLLAADDAEQLRHKVEHLLTFANQLSRAEVGDLAAELARTLDKGHARAAIIASNATELLTRLETLHLWLESETTAQQSKNVFLGVGSMGNREPRIGFIFPGQGSPAHLDGGILRRRFQIVEELYTRANLPTDSDGVLTSVAQPAIVTSSMAALRLLEQIGIEADVAVGHSLGELTAFHWGGAFDEETLLHVATVRGQAMANLGSPTGTMATIMASEQELKALLNDYGSKINVACYNSPRHTVISGEASVVDAIVAKAETQGIRAKRLAVSHAFHSPLVADAAPLLAQELQDVPFKPLNSDPTVQRQVFSTVTGAELEASEELPALLYQQITSPVRFTSAMSAAALGMDLLIVVGPGHGLKGLIAEMSDAAIVSLDAGGPSLQGLWQAVAAAFTLGAALNHESLFKGRFTKPFDLNWQPKFFVNPCELAPIIDDGQRRAVEQGAVEHRTVEHRVVDKGAVEHGAVDKGKVGAESTSPLELVRQLVAQRAELPPSAVLDEDRFLSDLHLNSIVVTQLMTEATQMLGLSPLTSPSDYADATIAETAQAFEQLQSLGEHLSSEEAEQPIGVDAWVRAFTVELVERPQPLVSTRLSGSIGTREDGEPNCTLFAPSDHPLADTLRARFEREEHSGALSLSKGRTVIVCLPPQPNKNHVSLLLDAAHQAQQSKSIFVLVQHNGGGAAFARTFHLERPQITTCVVDVPGEHPQAADWVLAEVKAAEGYREVYYDASGTRREAVLRLRSLSNDNHSEKESSLLGAEDVLLVTGGGKGITAECALSLALKTGCRLALMGRSEVEESDELASNLQRMAAAGVEYSYLVADVADETAVRAAVQKAQAELGSITGILHGAARNVPQLISGLDEESVRRTLAPKIEGARNLLTAVNPNQLHLFITFGSIIARTGLAGEADYGLANEWLTRLTEKVQQEQPTCRCLAIEWSIWGSVGMGARLSHLDSLAQQGILPIPLDDGVAMLHRLLAASAQADAPVATIVTSRFGTAATLKVEQPELPFLRFIEEVRAYYPGIELIVDTTLSTDSDPYLADHVFRGEQIFPAVMAFEAMGQVAMALAEESTPPTTFKEARFQRPIVVPKGQSVTIRIAALINKAGKIEIAIRSEATDFQVDHFRAICSFEQAPLPQEGASDTFPPLQIEPTRQLYGQQFFHKGRFQRVEGYRQLTAKECVAELAPNSKGSWFGSYLPDSLVLADPGARDAAIHAIQVCVPHQLLLPSGVEELQINRTGSAPHVVHARQRERKGNLFIYDVDVSDAEGQLLERWQGMHLHIVSGAAFEQVNIAPLLGPYMQRRLEDLLPNSAATIVVTQTATPLRQMRSNLAIQRALGKKVEIWRRPDGKPEVGAIARDCPTEDKPAISVAHAGDITLAVAGKGPLGCDIEPVMTHLPADTQSLLGKERYKLAQLIADSTGEDEASAITRVWAASESLKKAGAALHTPLMLEQTTKDGWVMLSSGSLITATVIAHIEESEQPLALAVLMPK